MNLSKSKKEKLIQENWKHCLYPFWCKDFDKGQLSPLTILLCIVSNDKEQQDSGYPKTVCLLCGQTIESY